MQSLGETRPGPFKWLSYRPTVQTSPDTELTHRLYAMHASSASENIVII
jgi:hypothetical protein